MVGYRRTPTSDPEEQKLRDNWHNAEDGEGKARAANRLAHYLWNRAEGLVKADRAKHPKAKRNQVHDGPKGEGRMLP